MLVLTRKVGTKLLIGSVITVEVIDLSPAEVGLKVVTPTSTVVCGYKMGEKVTIAAGITVEICGISPYQARLGIEAPRNISVDREEVRKRKTASNPGGRTKLSLSKRKS